MAPPIIITVDDDPEVSRSLARDLRQQYGEDYRIRRAESGAEALAALKELKLRNEKVGLLLADHRMPGMTGVEFLEQAREFYPKARRVLLTAYADTDAAIAAINRADVHYYLLKPWDPPQEKLYPVLDDLLEDWKMQDRLVSDDRVRVVGHRWSAPSHAVKDFLTRNQVPFRWLELERDAEAGRLLAANGGDEQHLPLVITDTGQVLQAPSTAEVAGALGLSAAPSLPFYDLIVIGGGPAGLGAAVYGASEGLRTVLVEREAIGGQAGQSSRIENYLGFPSGISGRRPGLAGDHPGPTVRGGDAADLGGRRPGGVRVGPGRAPGRRRPAVGARRAVDHGRRLPALARLPASTPSPDRGVYYGAATTEAQSCRDEDVYIVGGANSAGQAAVFFARTARSVTIMVRGRRPRTIDVPLPDPADRRASQRASCGPAARWSGPAAATTSSGCGSPTGRPAPRRRSRPRGCSSSSAPLPCTDWLGKEVLRDDNGFVADGPGPGHRRAAPC